MAQTDTEPAAGSTDAAPDGPGQSDLARRLIECRQAVADAPALAWNRDEREAFHALAETGLVRLRGADAGPFAGELAFALTYLRRVVRRLLVDLDADPEDIAAVVRAYRFVASKLRAQGALSAAHLAGFRQYAGLTQAELGTAVCLPVSVIAELEDGTADLGDQRLADAASVHCYLNMTSFHLPPED